MESQVEILHTRPAMGSQVEVRHTRAVVLLVRGAIILIFRVSGNNVYGKCR